MVAAAGNDRMLSCVIWVNCVVEPFGMRTCMEVFVGCMLLPVGICWRQCPVAPVSTIFIVQVLLRVEQDVDVNVWFIVGLTRWTRDAVLTRHRPCHPSMYCLPGVNPFIVLLRVASVLCPGLGLLQVALVWLS